MSEPNLKPEFEQQLREALDAPAPDAVFARRLRATLIVKAAEMTPGSSPERRPAPTFWRLAFVLLALALLGFFFGPKIVNAMRQLFGYIPGTGIIDQNAPLRVLAEPVRVTRDGITVTVATAVLTSDKTTIVYTVENVPFSAYPHDENATGCMDMAKIKLPDGGALFFRDGSGSFTQYRFSFSAIPVNVNEATFILPCIQNTLPGLAPENWQINLRFKPAPPDLTVVPVVEIQPTETSVPLSTETVPLVETSTQPSPLSLIKALQVGDDTILLFTLKQPESSGWIEYKNIKLADAQGKEIFATTPTIDGLPNFDRGVLFKSSVSFPVTVNISGSPITPVLNSLAEFEFDAGINPQPGQEWQPNQSIQIGGRTVMLTTIRADSRGGYSFIFTSDPDVTGLSLKIEGYTPNGGGGGGGFGTGQFGVTVSYAEVPKGKIKVELSNLMVAGPEQSWSMKWSPGEGSGQTSLYGASIKVDQFIPVDDGYYLIGHTEWNDARLKNLLTMTLKAQDGSGQEVVMEAVDAQTTGLTLAGNQWAYHIFGKVFQGAITLYAGETLAEFKNPALLQVDLQPYQFEFNDSMLGLPYKIGIKPLDVPGILASAFKVTYIKEGNLRGFEIAIEADPALKNLTFRIGSALNTAGMRQVTGSGNSFRDESTGLLLSQVLTDAKMSFPLVLAADSANISGIWKTTWNPPAPPSGATPIYAPHGCLTLDDWKKSLKNPSPLPSGLPARVLVARGAVSPDPSLFLINLESGKEQPLVFGNGSLSPDGSRLVYTDENGAIQILDIASGQNQEITSGKDNTPIWSPDGKKIAYLHQTDRGMNIFVMDANGNNQTALTNVTSNPELRGWAPDGRNLLVVAAQGVESQIGLLDLVTKEFKPLFSTKGFPWDIWGSISPDGQWLAYSEKVTGRIGIGIYISHLDGSGKRLLVQLDHWPAYSPVWSPDGKWLAFSAMNNDRSDGQTSAGLINVATCQVIPLAGLNGEIQSWAK
ncbi:MAG TPA: hypothetical protein VGK00_18345 [Anaerolineales bacterium]|jgi:hypothetical protein